MGTSWVVWKPHQILSINICEYVFKIIENMAHLKRSLPYLQMLHRDIKKSKDKADVLKKLPGHVSQDIVEAMYNIAHKNCKIGSCQKKKLYKYRKTLEKISNLVGKRKKESAKKFLYKQKGEFWSTIIPIIASVLGHLFK